MTEFDANTEMEDFEKTYQSAQAAKAATTATAAQAAKGGVGGGLAAGSAAPAAAVVRRSVTAWQPCRLLCKRFNVPDPFANRPADVPERRTATQELLQLPQHLLDITRSGAPQPGGGDSAAQAEIDPAAAAAAAKAAAIRFEASFSEASGEINPEKAPEKPSTDLFKAIFEQTSSSESDNEDEDEDDEEKEAKEQEASARANGPAGGAAMAQQGAADPMMQEDALQELFRGAAGGRAAPSAGTPAAGMGGGGGKGDHRARQQYGRGPQSTGRPADQSRRGRQEDPSRRGGGGRQAHHHRHRAGGPSPAAGRGRGRGATMPAWMTAQAMGGGGAAAAAAAADAQSRSAAAANEAALREKMLAARVAVAQPNASPAAAPPPPPQPQVAAAAAAAAPVPFTLFPEPPGAARAGGGSAGNAQGGANVQGGWLFREQRGAAPEPAYNVVRPPALAARPAEVVAFYGETSTASSRSILSSPSYWLSFDWASVTTVVVNGWIDRTMVCYAHSRGVRVLALVGCDGGPCHAFGTAAARDLLVSGYVATVEEGGLDGILYDWEHIASGSGKQGGLPRNASAIAAMRELAAATR
eukprot:SAG22_NODE_2903_length_2114_cov_3.317122_1_plen_583_part_10